MEVVELNEGYTFKLLDCKTLAVKNGEEGIFYCPFCYAQTSDSLASCGACNKNFPQIIYYHSDDETWIASGNE